MILSYAKPLNEKMCRQVVKIFKKKCLRDLSTLSIDDMKTKKKKMNLFCWYKNTQ